jgi:GYF domain 2
MEYFVKRGEQRFGPYSLSDLQRYVQSGNVLSEDLAQSEGMNEWVAVSQVLGNIPTMARADGAGILIEPESRLVSLPPNLHWSILLILSAITRQLFNLIWAVVQGNWARQLSGDNKPLVLVAMYPAGMIAGILAAMLYRQTAWVGGLLFLAGGIAYLFGVFSIKAAMEEYYNSTENIGLTLSGAMTFFFSSIYIQYHINRIARWKRTGLLS